MKGHILTLAAAALVVMFLCATAASFAHPATDITATYTPEGKKLVISVRHPVPNVTNHYISEITVTLDNKVIAKKTFTTQTSKASQDITFVVTENLNDKTVVVEAKCCVKGVYKKTFEFKKPEVQTTEPGATPQATPAATRAPAATKAPPGLPTTTNKIPASPKAKATPYPTATKKT